MEELLGGAFALTFTILAFIGFLVITGILAPGKDPRTKEEQYQYCLSQELDKQFCYEEHILGK